MCNYKVLHHNEHGYVVRCGSCGFVQVAFGTACIALTVAQFHRYKRSVESYYEMYRNEVCHNAKCVHMPTPAKSLTLVYTVKELKQLSELLEQADACLEVEKLMALPNPD